MEIEIRFWGNIGHYLPEGNNRFSITRSLDKDTTVQEVVKKLKLPKELPIIITVNGRRVDTGCVLKDRDVIAFFSSTGGG
jgi:sulfur carrier protein ThiS